MGCISMPCFLRHCEISHAQALQASSPSHLIMEVSALYVCFSILLRCTDVELATSSGLILVQVRPAFSKPMSPFLPLVATPHSPYQQGGKHNVFDTNRGP